MKLKTGAFSSLFYMAPWLLMLLAFFLFLFCPAGDLANFRSQKYSVVLTDRSGDELQVLPLDEGLRREYIAWENIPPEIRMLFIRSEDKYFLSHIGIDPKAILRALALNTKQKKIVSGASTITMQLARILNPHKGGYSGKLKEMLIALRYEANFSKKQIFSAWISSLPFGNNIEGLASASRMYFNCSPQALTIVQGAILSIIPRSPRHYSPGSNDKALSARIKELSRANNFVVSDAEISRLINKAKNNSATFSWPYYAEHFCRIIAGKLEEQKKWKGRIATSLDLDLQLHMEYIIREKVYSAGEHRISNGAAVVLEPVTRQILVWTGSVDYFSTESLGMNDGVLARTQPGSTLKPFLYELALEEGFSAATLLPDVPLEFGKRELYMPMNFNNHFNGPVRLRVALASSLNIPAVYTLDRIGINTFIERLKQLGFKSFSGDHDYFGLGIALGGVDVSLLELSNAYCSFADRGQYAEPVYFSNSGIPKKTKVMDELCVSVIQDILVDPVSRITGFGYFTTAARIKKAMIKTGTSNQFNNIWAVGTTPEYVVGVWMGNFTGDTIIGMPGSSLPARAVADFLMNMDLEKEFTPDPGLQKYEICSFSGQRKGPYCPDGIIEYFQPGIIPDECGFHKADRIVYPAEYAAWLQRASLSAQTGKAIQSGVHILTPIADAVFYIDPFQHNEVQQIAVEITAGTEDPVRLYYDGILLGEENYYLRHMLQLEKGKHTLVAESANKRDEVSFTVH